MAMQSNLAYDFERFETQRRAPENLLRRGVFYIRSCASSRKNGRPDRQDIL